MEVLVHWFTDNLSQHISREMVIFIISMIPILELRGGLLAASLLKVSAAKAIPICIIGNIIPIPFILLFIRQIFHIMTKCLNNLHSLSLPHYGNNNLSIVNAQIVPRNILIISFLEVKLNFRYCSHTTILRGVLA